MGAPFNVGVSGLPLSVQLFAQALQDKLNSQTLIERSYSMYLSGQRASGFSADNYVKPNSTTFEDWYIAGMVNGTALTTVAPAKDKVIAIPFVATHPYMLDGLGFEITTGSGANGKARVGVYTAQQTTEGLYYPGTLVAASIEFDATAVAVDVSTGLNRQMTEGNLYFAAYACGTNAPTIRGVAVGGSHPCLGMPSTLGTASQLGFTVSSTYNSSTLPITYPIGGTAYTTTIPAIAIRYSNNGVVTETLPVWSPAIDGYILRRVRLVPSVNVVPSTTGPYFQADVSVRRKSGATILGTYSSKLDRLLIGEPLNLTGKVDLDRKLQANDVLEVKITKGGRPLTDLNQIAVQFDVTMGG